MRLLMSVLALSFVASVSQADLVKKTIACSTPVKFPGQEMDTDGVSFTVTVNRIVAQKAYVMTVVSTKSLPVPPSTDPMNWPLPGYDTKRFQERVTLTQSQEFGSSTIFAGRDFSLIVRLSEDGMPAVLKRGSQVIAKLYCQIP